MTPKWHLNIKRSLHPFHFKTHLQITRNEIHIHISYFIVIKTITALQSEYSLSPSLSLSWKVFVEFLVFIIYTLVMYIDELDICL